MKRAEHHIVRQLCMLPIFPNISPVRDQYTVLNKFTKIGRKLKRKVFNLIRMNENFDVCKLVNKSLLIDCIFSVISGRVGSLSCELTKE